MTEAEWLAEHRPMQLLNFLRGSASYRKLRLFAAASFRRLAYILTDYRQRRGIELLEQMAEEGIRDAGRLAIRDVHEAIPPDDWIDDGTDKDHPHYVALMLYREFISGGPALHAIHAAGGVADSAAEAMEQRRLLNDIFGNPFRSVSVDTSWLTSTVVALSQGMYESRDFSAMPILADALQDAGCDEPTVLAHCRCEEPHVRGCWLLDRVLGKE